MSLPRQIIPGRTYLVTRRCTQRQFLMKPSPYMNQVYGYCLGLAQSSTQVEVHATTGLSNHYHHEVTDIHGNLPKFTYIFNKYVAKNMNRHYGRWENFWAAGVQTSYVHLASDAEKIDKLAYTVVNPVASRLVKNSGRWPGFLEWQPRTLTFERPKGFFREDGPMPDIVTLTITPLKLDAFPRPREVMEHVGAEIHRREANIRREVRAPKKTFLGIPAIMRQHHTDTPTSKEPRRQLSPQVACKDKWRRIELLRRLKQFAIDYRDALVRWLAGERDVQFPTGTYQLCVQFGVPVADV